MDLRSIKLAIWSFFIWLLSLLWSFILYIKNIWVPTVKLEWPSDTYYLTIPYGNFDITIPIDRSYMSYLHHIFDSTKYKQLPDLRLYKQDQKQRIYKLNKSHYSIDFELPVSDIVNVEAIINDNGETINITDQIYKWFEQTINLYDIPMSLICQLMIKEKLVIEGIEPILSIMKSDMSTVTFSMQSPNNIDQFSNLV